MTRHTVSPTPRISVVVPTYRRPDLLARCLDALAAQDVPPEQFEVVTVDDGSRDRTGDVLEDMATRMPNLVPIALAHNGGPAAARNRGVQRSSAPLVLFVDDDVVAPAGTVSAHLDVHTQLADPALGVLGRVDWHPDLRITPFMEWLDGSGLQFAYDTWLQPGPVEPPYAAFYTANLSMSRALFEAVGGFDERFPHAAYEDMELAWRLTGEGFRLVYAPEAKVFHARSINLAAFRSRMRKVGQSAELLRELQPDFPVDDSGLREHVVRRRELWRLRLLAGPARIFGWRGTLGRRYHAEVAAAYHAGRAEAIERSAEAAEPS